MYLYFTVAGGDLYTSVVNHSLHVIPEELEVSCVYRWDRLLLGCTWSKEEILAVFILCALNKTVHSQFLKSNTYFPLLSSNKYLKKLLMRHENNILHTVQYHYVGKEIYHTSSFCLDCRVQNTTRIRRHQINSLLLVCKWALEQVLATFGETFSLTNPSSAAVEVLTSAMYRVISQHICTKHKTVNLWCVKTVLNTKTVNDRVKYNTNSDLDWIDKCSNMFLR